jgi:hypothetical protein
MASFRVRSLGKLWIVFARVSCENVIVRWDDGLLTFWLYVQIGRRVYVHM